MKIDTYGINPADSQKEPIKTGKTSVERPFSDYLEKTLINQEGAVNSKGQISAMEPPTVTTPLSDTQENALMLGENMLGVLDRLSAILIDPGANDSALNPLADALSKNIEAMKEVRNSLAPGDPLRSTLDNIGTVSAVEVAKIQNGDYQT
ncbi:MAG: hypothetical protein M0022_02380 [Desulfobacteraceae bacterium]|nr:hypothetical protein [Desulfobacteraceae bacterium]